MMLWGFGQSRCKDLCWGNARGGKGGVCPEPGAESLTLYKALLTALLAGTVPPARAWRGGRALALSRQPPVNGEIFPKSRPAALTCRLPPALLGTGPAGSPPDPPQDSRLFSRS